VYTVISMNLIAKLPNSTIEIDREILKLDSLPLLIGYVAFIAGGTQSKNVELYSPGLNVIKLDFTQFTRVINPLRCWSK